MDSKEPIMSWRRQDVKYFTGPEQERRTRSFAVPPCLNFLQRKLPRNLVTSHKQSRNGNTRQKTSHLPARDQEMCPQNCTFEGGICRRRLIKSSKERFRAQKYNIEGQTLSAGALLDLSC